MFNGESKNRSINLSGKKYVILNKDSFIEKAKKEKEITLTLSKRKNAFRVISNYVSFIKCIEIRRKEIENVLSKRINDIILLEKIVSPDIYRKALQICLYDFSIQSTFLYSKINCYTYYKYGCFNDIYPPLRNLLNVLKLYDKENILDEDPPSRGNETDEISGKKWAKDENENMSLNHGCHGGIRGSADNRQQLGKPNEHNVQGGTGYRLMNQLFYRHVKEIDILVHHLDVLLGNYAMYGLNIYGEYLEGEEVENRRNRRDRRGSIGSDSSSDSTVGNIPHLFYLYNFLLNNRFAEQLGSKVLCRPGEKNKDFFLGQTSESLRRVSDYIVLTIDGLISAVRKILICYGRKNIVVPCASTKVMMHLCDIIYVYFYIIKIKKSEIKKDYIVDLKSKISILLRYVLLQIPHMKDSYYLYVSFFKYTLFDIFTCDKELKEELQILKMLLIKIVKSTYNGVNIMSSLIYSYHNKGISNKKFCLYNQESYDKKHISGVNCFKNLLLFIHTNAEIMNDNVIDILLEIYLYLPFKFHPYIYLVSDIKEDNAVGKHNNGLSHGKEFEDISQRNYSGRGISLELGYYYNKSIIDCLLCICKGNGFYKLDALLFMLLPFRSVHFGVYNQYRNYYDYVKNVRNSAQEETDTTCDSALPSQKTYPSSQKTYTPPQKTYPSSQKMYTPSQKTYTPSQKSRRPSQHRQGAPFCLDNLVAGRGKRGKREDILHDGILLQIKKILVQHDIHIYLLKKIYIFWMYNCKLNETLFFKQLLFFPYFDNTALSIYVTSYCFLLHYYIIANMYTKLIDIKNFKFGKSFMVNTCFKKVSKLLVFSLWIVLKRSIDAINFELSNGYIHKRGKKVEDVIDDIADEDIYNDEDEECEKEMYRREEEDIERIDDSLLVEESQLEDPPFSNFRELQVLPDEKKDDKRDPDVQVQDAWSTLKWLESLDEHSPGMNEYKEETLYSECAVHVDSIQNEGIRISTGNSSGKCNSVGGEGAHTSTMISYYLYSYDRRGLCYILPQLLRRLYEVNTYVGVFEEDFFVIKETFNLLRNRFNIIGESNNINPSSSNYDEDSSVFIEKNDIYLNHNIKYVNVLANYLLRYAPFTLPFDDRILIFYNLRNKSKENIRDDALFNFLEIRHNLIRRSNILEDAFITLNRLDSTQLKQNIRIAFTDKNGNEETGIDGGGLFKEFIILLCRELFHSNFILFQTSKNNSLFPKTYKIMDNLHLYQFSGKIVGKAIYERILIESVFNKVFLNLLLYDEININDIYYIDENVFNSLLYIQNAKNVDNLSLTFCTYEKNGPDVGDAKQYEFVKNYFLQLANRAGATTNRGTGSYSSGGYDMSLSSNVNTFFSIMDNLDSLISTLDRNLSSISRNGLQSSWVGSGVGSFVSNDMSVDNLDDSRDVRGKGDQASAETHEKDNIECVDLVEGGRNIPVNDQNKRLYIKLYINYKYNILIKRKTMFFLKGLSQLIPLKWLKLFNANELKTLISGNDKCFDVNDLRKNVVYGGGYNENSKTVLNLFEILNTFSPKEKSLFLMFVTSCSRSPLLGFQELHPKFCIFRVMDYNRLPTASTCVNLLKLPDYLTREALYKNLITAIHGTQGFDLS
ncbi:ubiquitin-protein ligase, putative [Plasmodium ovale curtisi]|uniref:HECT-type E3 ubiquitin transferase n=1 Tax=Plasmodium ovale curtisi TaxID=864141 RepID=A0A1A8WD90_PLAOA|nr:ubiquitin-protein ligase, putative [Plasmodium ovale curtisi]SBS90976.1 ubiquitin-protein ligase, putative [Plasmodium ovale curtisi]